MLLSTKLFLFILTNSRIRPENARVRDGNGETIFCFFFAVFFLKLRGRENRILKIQSNVTLSHFPHHGTRNPRGQGKDLLRSPSWYRTPWNSWSDGLKPTSRPSKGQPHHWHWYHWALRVGSVGGMWMPWEGMCTNVHGRPSCCGMLPEVITKAWCTMVQGQPS